VVVVSLRADVQPYRGVDRDPWAPLVASDGQWRLPPELDRELMLARSGEARGYFSFPTVTDLSIARRLLAAARPEKDPELIAIYSPLSDRGSRAGAVAARGSRFPRRRRRRSGRVVAARSASVGRRTSICAPAERAVELERAAARRDAIARRRAVLPRGGARRTRGGAGRAGAAPDRTRQRLLGPLSRAQKSGRDPAHSSPQSP